MDSGNSTGSIQSSSGGEEEFDSRAESISPFLNSSNQISSNMMLSPPSSSPHHSSHRPPFFDSLPNFLNTSSPPLLPPSNNNPFLSFDMAWARSLPASQPNCTNIGGPIRPSSPAVTITGLQPTNPYTGPTLLIPSRSENDSRPLPSGTNSNQPNPTRSSKKRPRASRRAPTTVLTTDTSNFRAMVQEFTGIPAPPFSAAASFARSRLDLFGTASPLRYGLSNPPPPPYPLRPFAQKVRPRPSFTSFPLSSSSSSSPCSSLILDVGSPSTAGNSIFTRTNIACNSAAAAPNLASAGNYRPPSDLGLPKLQQQRQQTQIENPMFSIQSLLQSSPKYLAAQGPMRNGGEEFPMNHGHLDTHRGDRGGTLANLIASDGMSSRSNNHDHPSWGDGSGGEDQSHLRAFDWNCSNSQRVSSCKMNYTASSSDFNVEKASENLCSRGEGMVESWICSSD